MEELVVVELIDLSSCAYLRNVFSNVQKKRSKQIEFLFDLGECVDQNSRISFLEYYKLPDEIIDDLNFVKELIAIEKSVLNIYKNFKTFKKEQLIYCKNVISYLNIHEINVNDREKAVELLKVDLEYYFKFPKATRESVFFDLLRMETMNSTMLARLDMNLIVGDEVIKSLVERGVFNLQLIRKIKDNHDLCLTALRFDRSILEFIKDMYDWWNDKSALDALLNSKKTEFYSYRSILQILKSGYDDNLDFISKIIEMDTGSYEFASERVRSDTQLAIRIIELDPRLHIHFHPSLLSVREIQMKILQFNPTHYYRLPKNFKYDKEFILLALNLSDGVGMLIAENIPVEFHSDEEVVNALICAGVLQNVDRSKLTRDQILQCVKADGSTIRFFNEYMTDLEILTCALKQNYFAFESIPKQYLTLDLILQILETNPDCLKYLPKEFRNMNSIIEAAITSPNFKIHTISCLPNDFIYSSEEIILTLILKTKGKAIKKISPTQLNSLSRSNIISCLKCCGLIFPDLSPQLQQDPHLLKIAIKHGYIPRNKL